MGRRGGLSRGCVGCDGNLSWEKVTRRVGEGPGIANQEEDGGEQLATNQGQRRVRPSSPPRQSRGAALLLQPGLRPLHQSHLQQGTRAKQTRVCTTAAH